MFLLPVTAVPSEKVREVPDGVGDSSRHRRGDPEGAMNPAKVVARRMSSPILIELEVTAADYNAARQKLAEVRARMDSCTCRIDQLLMRLRLELMNSPDAK